MCFARLDGITWTSGCIGVLRCRGGRGWAWSCAEEAYNFFNHPRFARPSAKIGNAGFASITATAVTNRQTQLAVRLEF